MAEIIKTWPAFTDARAVAHQLIESAKVEVQFLKVTGAEAWPEFFDAPEEKPLGPRLTAGAGTQRRLTS